MESRPRLKHSFSSPSFDFPHRRLHRRHTENALQSSGSSSEAWLNQAQTVWSLPDVQNGKANIDADTLTLNTSPFSRRKKRQKESLERTVEKLESFPSVKPPHQQSQVDYLVSLIKPHAEGAQIRRLESLASTEVANLYAAVERRDLPLILAAPLRLWTPNLLASLELSSSNLCMLACKWASHQLPGHCLREDDALVWLLQQKIPQIAEASKEEEKAFIKQCCRVWRHIPKETMAFLANVQLSLPLQEVGSIPTLLHFAFFRIWIPKHPNPKSVNQFLETRKCQNRIQKAAELLVTK